MFINFEDPTVYEIVVLIKEALEVLKLPATKIDVSKTKHSKYGDYSSNIALLLGSKVQKDNLELANLIKANIKKSKYVRKVQIVKPGFINFFLSNTFFEEKINQILVAQGTYGGNFAKGTVSIEFVSANPTGFLHIGHARNAAIGLLISRVLKFSGLKVIKEYYVNDGGKQINNLAVSVLERVKEWLIPDYKISESCEYQGEDVKECALQIKEFFEQKFLDLDEQKQINFLGKFAVDFFMDKIKTDCQKIDLTFDIFTFESQLYSSGKVDEMFQKLVESGHVFQKEGAWFLKTTLGGDDKDRVLKRSDGSFTYITPDFVYHSQKLNRANDLMFAINILGIDHISFVERLKYGLKVIEAPVEKLRILLFEQVKLLKEGKELKMSKRSGNTITMRSFLEMLGKDNAIYYLTARSINSVINVQVDLAAQKNLDNPVFAIQYSFARACQILKKTPKTKFVLQNLSNQKVIELINQILRWSKVVRDTIRVLKPEIICEYGLELARSFNSFYSQERILGSYYEEQLLAVVQAFKYTQHQVMKILGITAKEQI